MNKALTYCLLFIILSGFCGSSRAQQKIGGIINQYTKVTQISSAGVITVSDVSSFAKNDTVLLVQMTGVTVSGSNINAGNTGVYEFHIIEKIIGNQIYTLELPSFTLASSSVELVQLIRVPSYKDVQIESTLECQKWDGTTGGVLAFMAQNSVILNADINVSGKGFLGGKASQTAYTGSCFTTDTQNSPNFSESSALAGYKGDGIVSRSLANTATYKKGRVAYSANNGGGGGNGRFSGGGGGGNYGAGGQGGAQACNPSFEYTPPGENKKVGSNGEGGNPIQYLNNPWYKRVVMGGGGGSSAGLSTKGGDGGGIVIIVSPKIEFSGSASIKAEGESVSGFPTAGGAGGGGAGGSILVSINDFINFRASVMGGQGGYVDNQDKACGSGAGQGEGTIGAGGGGGGGIVYTSKNEAQFTADFGGNIQRSGALYGRAENNSASCGGAFPATNGGEGRILGDLSIPLKGFLFNYIITPDTEICSGQTVEIEASEPKGGTTYTYQWQYYNPTGANWTNIPGANQKNYTTDELYNNSAATDQVYQYRRQVTSGSLVDEGDVIQITVKRKITNELNFSDSTICGYVQSLEITGDVSGGDGTYQYQWQRWQEDNDEWLDIAGATSQSYTVPRSSIVPGTQRYHRVVKSVQNLGCEDTSANAGIHVLQVITGNEITPDQQLCETENASVLTGRIPTGGDPGQYLYNWEIKEGNNNWQSLGAGTPNYTPVEKNIGDTYYRRIVMSGPWNCCKDTSRALTVHFDALPSPAVVDPATQDLYFQFKTQLDADPVTTGAGAWSVIEGGMDFSAPDQPSVEVSGLQFGTNVAQWEVSSGVCPSSQAQATITVHDITIPSGFSPNHDGLNDCFRILGAENAISSELIIFNRDNNIVYQSSSFKGNSNDCGQGWWDGRNSSGTDLPNGTYFYQLKLSNDGTTHTYKGYVVLKR